jgi:hypothetical protein
VLRMLRVMYLVMLPGIQARCQGWHRHGIGKISKMCDTLSDQSVASVETTWLETKRYARCFVQRCTAHYVIDVLIV